jgi:Na+/H+ antiporter NhaD/arsenite permease-like protein
VIWLVNHRWWTLVGAFVLLLLGLVMSRSAGSAIPGVLIVVLFLLFFASLMALVGGRGSPPPPGRN